MKSRISTLALGVLLVFSSIAFADSKSDVYQEGLKKDAEAIAKMYHISPADALRRLKLQAAASDKLVVQLKEEFKERFAGIYIEHDPVDRLVVRLKGDTQVEDRKIEVDGDVLLVHFIHGQSFTKKELQEARDNHSSELRLSIEGLQGTYTDDRTGEVVLVVYMDKNDPIKIEGTRKIGESILRVPVRVRRLSSKLTTHSKKIRGGGNLVVPGCTTGFPVVQKNTGTKGITTAAHCGAGNASYSGSGNNNGLLIYQDGIWNGTVDIQWYTAASYPPLLTIEVEPKFYANSETTPRALTGRRTRASTKIGNNVCHRGATTGYSCGDVSATDFQDALCNGFECTATWVTVDPPATTEPGLACYGGDSGGPWFISTVALGIHHGGDENAFPWIGGCEFAIYMSTDYIDELGLQLYYGQ